MLAADHKARARRQRAPIGADSDAGARLPLGCVLRQHLAYRNDQARLLQDLTRQTRLEALGRIGPAARHLPLVSPVETKQDAARVVKADTLRTDRQAVPFPENALLSPSTRLYHAMGAVAEALVP